MLMHGLYFFYMNREKLKQVGPRIALLGGIILVLVAAGGIVYVNRDAWFGADVDDTSTQTNAISSADYQEATGAIKSSGTSSEDLTALVADYGRYYDKSVGEVFSTPSDKWTADTVDKAHLCLLYADKVGLSSQVKDIYSFIQLASVSKIDVDKNSAGMTQAQREEIYNRALASEPSNSETTTTPGREVGR